MCFLIGGRIYVMKLYISNSDDFDQLKIKNKNAFYQLFQLYVLDREWKIKKNKIENYYRHRCHIYQIPEISLNKTTITKLIGKNVRSN